MKNSSQKRDMNKFVRRSSLIFPINVERFLEKAYLRGADCIVMDLEDSISVNMKNEARALVKDSIPIVGKGIIKAYLALAELIFYIFGFLGF